MWTTLYWNSFFTRQSKSRSELATLHLAERDGYFAESLMLLGIVSDTHGHVEHTRQAVRMLESLEVHEVIHCGDIGSSDIVPLFAAWPTHFVLGNVDYDEPPLREAIDEC